MHLMRAHHIQQREQRQKHNPPAASRNRSAVQSRAGIAILDRPRQAGHRPHCGDFDSESRGSAYRQTAPADLRQGRRRMTPWPQAEQNFIKNRARSLSFCTIECSIHNAFNRFQETMSYRIDSSFVSENQDARVQILVLHYTENSFERALELLTKKAHGVSAHYLIPEQAAEMSQPFPVYQLVPEHGCAYHAGVSFWQGARLLNASSVGIEMANLGFAHEDQGLPLMARRWIPYPEAQFQAVGALAREIAARYQIAPHRVVGHSDIAPQRKIDPGPLFSWERLYREFGVGAWPDEDTVAFYTR